MLFALIRIHVGVGCLLKASLAGSFERLYRVWPLPKTLLSVKNGRHASLKCFLFWLDQEASFVGLKRFGDIKALLLIHVCNFFHVHQLLQFFLLLSLLLSFNLLLGHSILSFSLLPDLTLLHSPLEPGVYHLLHVLHSIFSSVFNRIWIFPGRPIVSQGSILLFYDVVFNSIFASCSIWRCLDIRNKGLLGHDYFFCFMDCDLVFELGEVWVLRRAWEPVLDSLLFVVFPSFNLLISPFNIGERVMLCDKLPQDALPVNSFFLPVRIGVNQPVKVAKEVDILLLVKPLMS